MESIFAPNAAKMHQKYSDDKEPFVPSKSDAILVAIILMLFVVFVCGTIVAERCCGVRISDSPASIDD